MTAIRHSFGPLTEFLELLYNSCQSAPKASVVGIVRQPSKAGVALLEDVEIVTDEVSGGGSRHFFPANDKIRFVSTIAQASSARLGSDVTEFSFDDEIDHPLGCKNRCRITVHVKEIGSVP